jgi:hypothetical protein
MSPRSVEATLPTRGASSQITPTGGGDRQPGTELIGPDGCSTRGPRALTRTCTRACGTPTSKRFWSVEASISPRAAKRQARAAPAPSNGHQVVLANLRHADDFWAYEPRASSRLLEQFLDTGRVDTSLYTPNRIDFTPSVSHGAIAKILLAVLLSFAALTILSLLWMPFRSPARPVRRRPVSACAPSLVVCSGSAAGSPVC